MSIFDGRFVFLRDRGGVGRGQNCHYHKETEVDPYNLALVIGAEEDGSCEGELAAFCDGVFCEIGIVQMQAYTTHSSSLSIIHRPGMGY
jgi:hypothetical protein